MGKKEQRPIDRFDGLFSQTQFCIKPFSQSTLKYHETLTCSYLYSIRTLIKDFVFLVLEVFSIRVLVLKGLFSSAPMGRVDY